ncbi:Arf family guanine nucleotide exchange factor YEL1 PWA37_004331 [Arxiozyma heterogenica]
MKSQTSKNNIMSSQTQLNTNNFTLSSLGSSLLRTPLINNNSRDSFFSDEYKGTGINDSDSLIIKDMTSYMGSMSVEGSVNASPNILRQETISTDNSVIIAQEIFDGTYNAISYKEYANFLGEKTNNEILSNFILLLRPLPYSLLSVLHKLSNNLYLIAESQNMDKILEEVSKQWVNTYPDSKWGNRYQLCHIILFSLLILNSDMHNEENKANQNYNKFTCEEFISNTLTAIEIELNKSRDSNFIIFDNYEEVKMDLTNELVSYYESLKYSALPVLKIRSNEYYSKESRDDKSIMTSRGNHIKRTTSSVSTLTKSTSISIFDKKSLRSIKSQLNLQNHDFDKKKRKNLQDQKFNLLYVKEPFDDQFIEKRCPIWIIDTVLYLYEDSYKILKLFKGQLNSEIDYHPSSHENEFNNDKTSSNISNNSYNSRSSFKSKSSFLLKWLKKQQKLKQHQFSNNYLKRNHTAFLESDFKWLKLRIKINEGRLFIYKDNKERQKGGEIYRDTHYQKGDCFVIDLFDCTAELLQTNIIISKQNDSSDIDHSNYNININIPYNDINHQHIINNSSGSNSSKNGKKNYNENIVLQLCTTNKDKADYIVKCINFWASRISSIPDSQFELVSNEEYGWSNKVLSLPFRESDIVKLNQIKISEWKPLLSILDIFDIDDEEAESYMMIEKDQKLNEKLNELNGFIIRLDELIDKHNQIKPDVINIWNETRQFDKVMNNWNNKYLFLNNQYQRQLTYYNILNEVYLKYCVPMRSDNH